MSGFNPSIGIISFANVPQEPDSAFALLIGIGSTSFATDSSSPQHDLSHVLSLPGVSKFVLKELSGKSGIFVRSGVGLGVVETTLGSVIASLGGVTTKLGEEGGEGF